MGIVHQATVVCPAAAAAESWWVDELNQWGDQLMYAPCQQKAAMLTFGKSGDLLLSAGVGVFEVQQHVVAHARLVA